ncbi:peptidase domain-containing ABC transporter [Sinomicrobium kalidii]|uniref:peptidase domain-containing ABC transporter n=1 Tax=Sinomicrobium kalidii TaxID=2900738 RepID=UPI001E3F2A15|nr:peptidase domain-containing ABC transporter [Sinomicrobium kalidii]UGU14451.1 peptidase domain-containing ABC transporter [Sinomicrobium kalidii]
MPCLLHKVKNYFNSFPEYIQTERKDCGPSCIKIISKFYKRPVSIEGLRELCETTREGSTLTGLIKASKKIGYDTKPNKLTLEELISFSNFFPVILHWNQNHFVVLYKVKRNKFFISDPEFGKSKYDVEDFLKHWIGDINSESKGVALFLKPNSVFYENIKDNISGERSFGEKFSILLKEHLVNNKRLFYKLVFFTLIFSSLEFLFPFIIQGIVDDAIRSKSYELLTLLSISYVFLYITSKLSDVIREWVLIFLSMKINVSLVSSFISKLSQLPISYFDSKLTGDLIERIDDHDNIEDLLLSGAISTVFSIFSLSLYSVILLIYNVKIFLLFFLFTVVYFVWVFSFFKLRKRLDYKRFSVRGKENSVIIEIINGMQELKLNNAEHRKRRDWREIKSSVYNILMSILKVEQLQLDGASFINEIKKIGIIVIASYLVINNNISIGMLLSISFILGQTNSPLKQLVLSFNKFQDAKISLERIFEIHNKRKEEKGIIPRHSEEFFDHDIEIKDLNFKYSGKSNNILHSVNLLIPANKTTAIVGTSGSGKTTLLKILLKFYENYNGEILIGDKDLKKVDYKFWRDHCGVVMQEGYIFNDSILNNIILEKKYNEELLKTAINISNLGEVINDLPLGLSTMIGNEGLNLSTGQKQRILIARAVYKNPKIILFDEATSALDAKNEKEITDKLKTFFRGRTVIIIAHRLSTVRNADNLLVIEKGFIKEKGNHNSLIKNQDSFYYHLVQNQLNV